MKVNLKWSQALRGLVNRLWVTSVLSHWQHVLIASRKCERGYAWLAYLCCLNLSHLDENHITRARTQHDFSMSLAVSLSPVQLRAGGTACYRWKLSSLAPCCWHRMKAAPSHLSSGTHTEPGQRWELWHAHSEHRGSLQLPVTPSVSFLRGKSCYKAFYLGFLHVYFCGIVVNTQLVKLPNLHPGKKGHTAFGRKLYQKVVRGRSLKIPRNSQSEEESLHGALNKGLV